MTTIEQGIDATLRGWYPSALSRDSVASCQRDEGVDVPRNSEKDRDAEQRWRVEEFDPVFDAMVADGSVRESTEPGVGDAPDEPTYVIGNP